MKSQLPAVPATDREPTVTTSSAQALPTGADSLSATVRMIHDSPRQTAQRRMLRGFSAPVVQRESVGDIKASLVADSGDRTSTTYRALLASLDEIQLLEARALTSADFRVVQTRIEQLIPTVDTARSNKGFSVTNETRVARNDALDTLKADLRAKANEMARKINADVTTAAPAFAMGQGPKAGFEMEYAGVLVFDITKVTDFQRREIISGAAANKSKTDSFWPLLQKRAGYGKRKTLFTAPHNTWEGQADSTQACSNLELVTKPLTSAEWQLPGGAAEQDAAVLARVTEVIKQVPERTLLMPAEIDASIRLQQSGVRLYKKGTANEPQIQMTAAVDVVDNGQPVPPWWLDGMHWTAIPSITNVVNGMVATDWGIQKNPKSGAFLKGGLNVLVKSPIPRLLGTPTAAFSPDQRDAWVQGMEAMLNVAPGASATAIICGMSVNLNPQRSYMHLRPGAFTWRKYFLELISGTDLISAWAATAFGTEEEPEDAGVGQIDDTSLDHTKVIEEHRETQGITSKNYLNMARLWAGNGAVPYGA